MTDGGKRTKGLHKRSREKKPLVSVVTVVFNGVKDIEETIRSVTGQSYDNFEYIVIDGGSTDGTIEIIKQYDGEIDYWVSEPDRGIYDAMNKGIRLARGEWLNFMNAGDLFTDKEVLEKVFANPDNYVQNDFIYSDTLFRCRSGVRIFCCNVERRLIIHQSIIYRKEVHSVSGNYLVANGLTIADYLFFMINMDRKWFKFNIPICLYNPVGVSTGLGTYKQKLAVDIMLGYLGRIYAALLLTGHPSYVLLRKLLQRLLAK